MSTAHGHPAAPHRTPKYLLDVNVLLAVIWAGHPQHAKAFAWLAGNAKKSEEVTDHYLADLAAKHDARLGTFDRAISHAAVEVIA